jgi:predicted component of type VI protein secretion system
MSNSEFRLIIRTGPNEGMAFDLTKEATMMGRDVSNDIVLADTEVSRQHARITKTPGGYVFEDLGSTNGCFINGERLLAPRVLKAGDLLGLGENVTLTFDAVAPEAAATVIGGEARAPAQAQPAPQQPPPQPVAQPRAAPAAAAPAAARPAAAKPAAGKPAGGRKRNVWIFAGIGCLSIVLVCSLIMAFMPSSWWCILLTPLTWFGYNFAC